jgi:uncharacterized protein YutE (UPF0331/DUF86 family)
LVDARSIESRLERLRILLGELDEIRAGGRDAFDADPRLRLATERALQLSIQACIDVAGHLVAELELTVPPDYRGLFPVLKTAGLDSDLAARLGEAAGLRNILVHDYLDLDDGTIWGALAHLDDLREFAAFVVATLDQTG